MPERSRIILVEDNTSFRRFTKDMLELLGGHQVLVEAGTLEEAVGVALVAAKEKEVNVGILDGNLTPRDESCNDGRVVAEALRKSVPGIRILALSYSKPERADYGDAYLSKSSSNLRMDLLKSVQDL